MNLATTTQFDALKSAILPLVPQHTQALARFHAILEAGDIATVTVVGKYNHGKSRLLNELIKEDIFKVADKRETTQLSDYLYNQVRWLDAPGLDADVHHTDDEFAQVAIWQHADIRLFVHSLREGEFDDYELTLLLKLIEDEKQTHRQNLVVFTQIDQVADNETLAQICQRLQQQLTLNEAFFVSAQRHRMGLEKNKSLLVEKSGIAQLERALTLHLAKVPQIRVFEKSQICQTIRHDLTQLQNDTQQKSSNLTDFLAEQRHNFDQELLQILDKIQQDLQPIMVVDGKDASLEADSFAMKYQLTQGKKDRNRIQVAYSRACIDLNSHLIRYGVVGLPEKQKTSALSLNSVIVAVLGISVKLRRELNIIFFQSAGRQRLQREFAHYFELSQGRMADKQRLRDFQNTLSNIETALTALAEMEQL